MNHIIGALCAAALISTASVSYAQDRTLRIATSVPDHHYLTVSIKRFADEVTERTDGDIKFEIYPAQSLVTDQQMDEAVAHGTVDIGVASASILAGTVPALNIFAVPFYFDTREKLEAAVVPGKPLREMLDEGIEATGSRAAFWIPFGSIALVTRDKEVRLPDDVLGMKIRTFGATVSQFIEAVGGAPVVTSGGEQFLALQRGIVDGGLTGWSSIKDRRLYEVSSNVTDTDHMYETHFALMSQRMWDGLTPEQQEIFAEVGEALERELLTEVFDYNDNIKAELADRMASVSLTDEERDIWKEATKDIANAFYERGDDLTKRAFEEAQKVQ